MDSALALPTTPRSGGESAVEVYLETEMTPTITDPAALASWHEAVEKLNLVGQLSVVRTKEKSPIPFPQMNSSMMTVYGALCPRKQKLEEFDGGAIPMRVLEAAQLCTREAYFDQMYVWSDTSKPDPVLVGMKKVIRSGSTMPSEVFYLIARWGDELRAFAELKKMAVERLIADRRRKLTATMNRVQAGLDNIEIQAQAEADGERGFEYIYVG